MFRFKSIAKILLILFTASLVGGESWYDSNINDLAIWEYRVPIVVEDTTGLDRQEPIVLRLSDVFGNGFNYSSINLESIRVVDPMAESNLNEVGGNDILYQIDDFGIEDYSGEDELVFMVNLPAKSQKIHYIYYSDHPRIIKKRYTSDLNVKFEEKTAVIENSKAIWEGFSTGYFTLYTYKNRDYDANFLYPTLGLDYGYSIDSSNQGDSSFVRYDKYWSCGVLSNGSVRVQINCSATSDEFNVWKLFTFFSDTPYYESKNNLVKRDLTWAHVRWNIYDVVQPFFTKRNESTYGANSSGLGDNRTCYVAAVDTEEGGTGKYVFMIFGRGSIDCHFIEDKVVDFDLFGTVSSLRGAVSRTYDIRYLFKRGDLKTAESEYSRFVNQPRVTIGSAETNYVVIQEPNLSTIYDTLYDEGKWISIKASQVVGGQSVVCELIDSNDNIVVQDIRLYNDGTHGDSMANDNIWLNNQSYRISSDDTTGVWRINCTEEGSQTIPTYATNNFFVTYEYGYRRIAVTNVYCRVNDTYKDKPAKVRPGEIASLQLCLRNIGNQDERNIEIRIPNLPDGWILDKARVDRLDKGKDMHVNLTLHVPIKHSQVTERLDIQVLDDGAIRGVDYVLVDVRVPSINVHVFVREDEMYLQVFDDEGDPVQNGNVSVTYSSKRIEEGYTDATGYMKLKSPESGKVNVEVLKEGYRSTSAQLFLQPKERINYISFLPIALAVYILLLYYILIRKKG